jgi:hypothetical protein
MLARVLNWLALLARSEAAESLPQPSGRSSRRRALIPRHDGPNSSISATAPIGFGS